MGERRAPDPRPRSFEIVRAFNNNVVSAKDADGRDYVLMGRGLGFGAKSSKEITASQAERVFRPAEGEAAERLVAMIAEIDPDHLDAADAVARLVEERLDITVAETFVLPLADHIAMAVRRAEDGTNVRIPLVSEVSYAFPAEIKVAREALDLIRTRLGVALPDDEAAAIALHVLNAVTSSGDMPTTFHLTASLSATLRIVNREFGIEVDPASVAVARFATHLRYLILRLQKGRQDLDTSQFLWESARAAHPLAHQCAVQVGRELGARTGQKINREEELYLTLHVIRLVADA